MLNQIPTPNLGRTLTSGFERRLENHFQAVCDNVMDSAYNPNREVGKYCLGVEQGWVEALRYVASELAVAGDTNACIRINRTIDACMEQASHR